MNLFDSLLQETMVERGDRVISVSMFLSYFKNKENLLGNPVAKQSVRDTLLPRSGAKVLYDNGERYYRTKDLYINRYQPAIITKTEEDIRRQVLQIMQKNNIPKMTGKIAIESLAFVYAPLKSMSKKQLNFIESGGYILKATAPDLMDNLPKLLFDSMEKALFDNDSKICLAGKITKVFGNKPGVFIKLKGEI